MKTGSIFVKNPSILYISGTNVGETLVIGNNYYVEYVEAEPND
jgi:hypothetical protein